MPMIRPSLFFLLVISRPLIGPAAMVLAQEQPTNTTSDNSGCQAPTTEMNDPNLIQLGGVFDLTTYW